jgi:predicted DNA-binding transcriptional regulator AlpA
MSVASKNERTATMKITRPPERRLGPIQGTDRLMTMAEVSDLLGIPISTLYGWRHRGEGPAGYRIGPCSISAGGGRGLDRDACRPPARLVVT